MTTQIGDGMDRNSIIIVTGTSRGIGASIAAELARAGFRVGCLSRQGKAPAGLSPADAARCISVACDVTSRDSVRKAFANVAESGPIGGLVNNAGILIEGPSASFAAEDFAAVMETNATSVFTACQEVYPYLTKSPATLIVNIGSFFDKLGVKGSLAYCASKAAVGAITRCLAVEWAAAGVRVVDVAPGYIVTDFNKEALASGPLRKFLSRRIPGGEPGSTGDVAKLVGALYAHDIPFLSGETIYIDGAQGVCQ